MKPDNSLIVRYGLMDADFLNDIAGNYEEIDRMILIYCGLQTHQSVTSYHGTITDEQDTVDQRYGKYPSLTTEGTTNVTNHTNHDNHKYAISGDDISHRLPECHEKCDKIPNSNSVVSGDPASNTCRYFGDPLRDRDGCHCIAQSLKRRIFL